MDHFTVLAPSEVFDGILHASIDEETNPPWLMKVAGSLTSTHREVIGKNRRNNVR